MRFLLATSVLLAAACAGQPPDDTEEPNGTAVAVSPDTGPAAEPPPPDDTGATAEPAPPPAPPAPSPIELRAREVLAEIAAGEGPGERPYRWLEGPAGELLVQRIAPPDGFAREPTAPGTFADWLRHLPLKPAGSPVLLHDGELKGNQDAHVAVIDMDVGRRDLQQCADAVMRLRAEYLFSAGREQDICFRSVQGKKLRWRGSGMASFRKYLDKVFGIANSASLMREMIPVAAGQPVEVGDVLIEPASSGRYGHAVMLVDMAVSPSGERVFLLTQSYMPAQESHILKNRREPDIAPWYRIDPAAAIDTPEWGFPESSLRRFADKGCP